jgi:hypothetical protein
MFQSREGCHICSFINVVISFLFHWLAQTGFVVSLLCALLSTPFIFNIYKKNSEVRQGTLYLNHATENTILQTIILLRFIGFRYSTIRNMRNL